MQLVTSSLPQANRLPQKVNNACNERLAALNKPPGPHTGSKIPTKCVDFNAMLRRTEEPVVLVGDATLHTFINYYVLNVEQSISNENKRLFLYSHICFNLRFGLKLVQILNFT